MVYCVVVLSYCVVLLIVLIVLFMFCVADCCFLFVVYRLCTLNVLYFRVVFGYCASFFSACELLCFLFKLACLYCVALGLCGVF